MAAWIALLILAAYQGVVLCQQRGRHISQCDQSSCYPATGDLLVGRESRLSTTSTCGLTRTERYCIVSHLEDQNNKCFVCDSRQPYELSNKISHRIENIVSTFKKDWRLRWWQAQNGIQGVSIRLDLEAEFHFTHLIMRFKTFRPSSMLIERSYDFGKTWKVYRYFAYDCADAFPRIPTQPIRSIQDVICESRYSDVAPSTEGEVIFRVLPANVEIEDPYSEEVQDLLKMTNLRVNFTKLHTLGDNLLDSRAEIKEKYYYSLYNMVVRGSCSCYGHASRCMPLPGQEDNANMVHGQCQCTHNTKGLNCEQCDDFYNDLPWRPARGRETNACKECQCNGHSSRCHFDPAVYEATGRTSGGVCDDCQHNTMGHHCEECKPFYYPDPQRDITDPYLCQSCDCDPVGSEHGGECESRTDYSQDLVAGRCLCKRFVEGRRCDTCKTGFWNMRAENHEGCEPCGCSAVGTVGSMDCDRHTGECRCKRFVTGRQCNECPSGYWGLGSDPQGCKLCDCDVGGAYDLNCDQQSGQCRCRPNIVGRRCDQAEQGHFIQTLDWERYEGEFAFGIGNTRVELRDPTPGRPATWTGPGFMRCNEGDKLEFTIDDIPYSMEYDIIVRYEAQMPLRWEDVRMSIIRPGPVDQRGPCANSIPRDDLKTLTLSQGARHYLVIPSTCLEKGVIYKIRIEFNRYRSDRSTAEANVLIDSIVLMPAASGNPILQPGGSQNLRADYERFRCKDHHMTPPHTELSDVCMKLIFSSAAAIYDGAQHCQCNPTGSEHFNCNTVGGQCPCKPNVIGRQCDKCASGTFGFGPAGCILCECSAVGALDNACEPTTGQCKCVSNAFGRQCASCQRGYYGFPSCRQCQCNGRADECDDSGDCLNCRDNMGGARCDRCADGFYGDLRSGCRPCMCPGGQGSGYQHGETCRQDQRTGQIICDCKLGYTGVTCDKCADNYFGRPLSPGGKCERCDCNRNIDYGIPGSCDSQTGECLKCQFNSEGYACERCKSGYYGDATRQNCQKCVCNLLGTRGGRNAGPCDPITGQCQCNPHATGLTCGQCEVNYWRLASGVGCDSCDCDPYGSLSTQCNEYDGQCHCKPDRGGRDCRDCPDNSWGDPRTRCSPCDCNLQGSANHQCNRHTGRCECAPGVAGEKCDRCARGTTGNLPHCVPCGECFDNWDKIIMEISNETSVLIREGKLIKKGGASGAFEREFREMEEKLEEVKRILDDTGVSPEGLEDIKRKLELIRINLTTSSTTLDHLDDDVRNTTDRVEAVNNRIDSIKVRIELLIKAAKILRDNATDIITSDVSGAFNDIKQSYNRSNYAHRRVESTVDIVRRSELVRIQVDDLIRQRQRSFDDSIAKNDVSIRELNISLVGINSKIVDLNDIVCDGRGDPCDNVCGGAGCGKCGGGLSCEDGAVSKSTNAQDMSKRAETALKEKQKDADMALDEVTTARDQCEMAQREAQMAYDRAEAAKNESESSKADLVHLIEAIQDFLNQKGAKPQEIRDVAEEVLRMTISLTPDQIRDLAKQIEETIRGLTDIDTILDNTRADLERVKALEKRAIDAKKSAEDVLRTAQRIIDLLQRAKVAQDAADKAINSTRLQIMTTESDLNSIEQLTTETNIQVTETETRVHDLRDRVNRLKQKFTENEINVKRASDEAKLAEELANKADKDANELETKYSDVSRQLELKYNETRIAKERADQLKDRASTMFTSISTKVSTLRDMESSFGQNERQLILMSTKFNSLNMLIVKYLESIQEAAKYHRTCTQ